MTWKWKEGEKPYQDANNSCYITEIEKGCKEVLEISQKLGIRNVGEVPSLKYAGYF